MTITDYERWEELVDRESRGEPLSLPERELLARVERTDERARAERELLRAFERIEGVEDERSAELAVRAVAVVRSARRPRRRSVLPWLAGALAAAAAFAVWFRHEHRSDVPGGPYATIEYVTADVRVGGTRAELGAHVSVGRDVNVSGGTACFALEPGIHACFADGANVRLTRLGDPSRRVDLLRGRGAFALRKLSPGERFSVVANGVFSTAIGTAFTVELDDRGGVRTIVHEGKVAVGGENDGTPIGAHKIGLAHDGRVDLEPVLVHASTETDDWHALAQIAGRSIEDADSMPRVEPASPPEPPATPAVSGVEVPARAPAPAAPPSRRAAESKPAAPASASELLAAARQALRDQRWEDAAAAYQNIVSTYPASPEARTVLVPLAGLDIERLGRPVQGLELLDDYLATGGPLAVEARLGRIRALAMLGRRQDEVRAIDEFLAAHPSSLEAPALRARRDELEKVAPSPAE
jgi:hypothetical protein